MMGAAAMIIEGGEEGGGEQGVGVRGKYKQPPLSVRAQDITR